MSAIAPQPVSRLKGTTAAFDSTGRVTLSLSDAPVKLVIRRVKIDLTAGSCANFR